jgi:hypothetical protein
MGKHHQEKVYIPAQQPQLTDNARVAIAVVTDPHSETGEKIQITRSLRDDPLGWLHSRNQIDEAQYQAGRKWQKLHECSTIGVIQAIDPAKEAVDGGMMRDFLTDRQIDAFKQLAESYKELGKYGGKLVCQILGEGRSISEVAAQWGYTGEREITYFGRRFRECLEALAIHWGFAQPKRPFT